MKYLFRLTLLTLVIFLSGSCKKDDPQPDEDTTLPVSQRVNKFIESKMKDIYYWADLIQNKEIDKELEPQEFLNKIKADDYIDPWTVLYKDGMPVRSTSMSGGQETTLGYKLIFYNVPYSTTDVYALIEYIYPGSSAEEAGLKRGDMITRINSENITTTNYTHVVLDDQLEIQLGKLKVDFDQEKAQLTSFDKKYQLSARRVTINPILKDTVFEIDNHKIGYLAYSEFIDNGSSSLNQLNEVMGEFKTAAVDEFILDLRYNPGGAITSARRLSSLLAPAQNVSRKDLLISKVWNTKYQKQFQDSPELLTEHFDAGVLHNNLNLSRLFVLTGTGTASASELVISGLQPYTEVITIGEKTRGKFVGSIQQIPDDSDLKNWELYPIVFAYKNAAGSTVKDGITPTYDAFEFRNYLYPFGDIEDPLLNKAIRLITGQPEIASTSARTLISPNKPLKYPGQEQREILIQK